MSFNDADDRQARDTTAELAAEGKRVGGTPTKALLLLGRARGHCLRFIKLLLGASADLVQFRVQASNLNVKLVEAQTMSSDQLLGLNPGVVLRAARLQVNTRRGLLRPGIALQVREIET